MVGGETSEKILRYTLAGGLFVVVVSFSAFIVVENISTDGQGGLTKGSGTSTQATPINEPADELMLSADDIPSEGWREMSSTVEEGYAERGFVSTTDSSGFLVELTVHDSVSDARSSYDAELNGTRSRYAVSDIPTGDEGFSYREAGESSVAVFRVSEVLVRVTYTGRTVEETEAVAMSNVVEENINRTDGPSTRPSTNGTRSPE
jgi:hypothetical protein